MIPCIRSLHLQFDSSMSTGSLSVLFLKREISLTKLSRMKKSSSTETRFDTESIDRMRLLLRPCLCDQNNQTAQTQLWSAELTVFSADSHWGRVSLNMSTCSLSRPSNSWEFSGIRGFANLSFKFVHFFSFWASSLELLASSLPHFLQSVLQSCSSLKITSIHCQNILMRKPTSLPCLQSLMWISLVAQSEELPAMQTWIQSLG